MRKIFQNWLTNGVFVTFVALYCLVLFVSCDKEGNSIKIEIKDTLITVNSEIKVDYHKTKKKFKRLDFIWTDSSKTFQTVRLSKLSKFHLYDVLDSTKLFQRMGNKTEIRLVLQISAIDENNHTIKSSEKKPITITRLNPCVGCECIPYTLSAESDTVAQGKSEYKIKLQYTKPCKTRLVSGKVRVVDDSLATKGSLELVWRLSEAERKKESLLLTQHVELQNLAGEALDVRTFTLFVQAPCKRACQCVAYKVVATVDTIAPGSAQFEQACSFTKPCGTRLLCNAEVLVTDTSATKGRFNLPWFLTKQEMESSNKRLTKQIDCVNTAGTVLSSQTVQLVIYEEKPSLIILLPQSGLSLYLDSPGVDFHIKRSSKGTVRWRLDKTELGPVEGNSGKLALPGNLKAGQAQLVAELWLKNKLAAADSIVLRFEANAGPESEYLKGDLAALVKRKGDVNSLAAAQNKAQEKEQALAIWYRLALASKAEHARAFGPYPLAQRVADALALHKYQPRLGTYLQIFDDSPALAFVEFRVWDQIIPDLADEMHNNPSGEFMKGFLALRESAGLPKVKDVGSLNTKEVKILLNEYQLQLAEAMKGMKRTLVIPKTYLPEDSKWMAQYQEKKCVLINNLIILYQAENRIKEYDAMVRRNEVECVK